MKTCILAVKSDLTLQEEAVYERALSDSIEMENRSIFKLYSLSFISFSIFSMSPDKTPSISFILIFLKAEQELYGSIVLMNI